ncbi:MAG: hypothetical protein F6K31_21060 [Symploca sp. SIO2G7]|nr:hypothetical protein [Symploca sp. SIO2G7]
MLYQIWLNTGHFLLPCHFAPFFGALCPVQKDSEAVPIKKFPPPGDKSRFLPVAFFLPKNKYSTDLILGARKSIELARTDVRLSHREWGNWQFLLNTCRPIN